MTENSPATTPAQTQTPAQPALKDYTVIGYWESETRPVAVGVIEGDHPVDGGEDATGYGDWATLAQAINADEAETLALAEMKATTVDEDEDDTADTDEEGA